MKLRCVCVYVCMCVSVRACYARALSFYSCPMSFHESDYARLQHTCSGKHRTRESQWVFCF